MDPLSITASIIAVLQLSAKVLGYLSDVKDAPKDGAKCAIEAANAYNLLMNLKSRLEDENVDAPWYTAVRALGVENGPLDQFKQALEELQNGMVDKGRLHQAGKALVWKFKKEAIASILARIERLKTLVGIALEMDHFKLSQAIKEDTNFLRTHVSATKSQVDRIRQDQADEKHKKMTEWISPTNYPAQQTDIIARKQEGTGQGFLNAPKFAKWTNEPKGTLFCPGIPGVGKTMVAAIAIDHLLKYRQNSSVRVAYVYCNYKAQEEQNASSMLAAIVKQLVQSRTSVVEPVARLYEQHSQEGTKPSLDEISATLREVIADYSTVYVVIDALDECKDSDGSRRQFLAKLQDLQTGQDVRLMATSRFIPEIEEEFKQAEKLEIRASDEDVRRFVAGQMYRLPKCIQRDSALQQLVEERISERVDGMFLLARLHVDSLLDKTTAKKVKIALDNISKGSAALDDAYKDALQRIESQLAGQCELAKQVLSWITYAKRPLTTTELCCALAVEPEETELDLDNIPDPEDLLSVCAGLAIVDQKSAVVRLVHYTTQEYFERFMDTWNPSALLDITSTCLTYLSFDTFQTGSCQSPHKLKKRFHENKFLDYAAKHWGEHAITVQNEAYALISSFLRNTKLASCAMQAFLVKKEICELYIEPNPESSTGLHLAARIGLSSIIEKELADEEQERAAVLTKHDDSGRTLLDISAENGHYRLTELLLEKYTDVNGKTRRFDTPLYKAATSGHESIVQLLLEKGADANASYGFWGSALESASAKGYETIVKLLLKEGADPNALNRYGRSVLEAASANGQETIVKLLLEKGADVNAKDEDRGGSALEIASAHGQETIVKLLLEKGADLNARNRYGRSALEAASANGRKTVVKLLLEKGADLNARTRYGRSALEAASAIGNETIVKLLLEKGADVNARGEYAGSALEVALANGHKGVAKLLWDASVGEGLEWALDRI